jgi:hypothetical protein
MEVDYNMLVEIMLSVIPFFLNHLIKWWRNN